MDNGRGLARVILILVFVGFIMGLALIGSDLVNPIRRYGDYQQKLVEVDEYKASSEVRVEAEKEQIASDMAYREQLHAETLKYWQILLDDGETFLVNAGYIMVLMLGLCGVVFSIGLTVAFVRYYFPPQDAMADMGYADEPVYVEDAYAVWHPNSERIKQNITVKKQPQKTSKRKKRKAETSENENLPFAA